MFHENSLFFFRSTNIPIPGPHLTSLVREVTKLGETQSLILEKLTEMESKMNNQENCQSVVNQSETEVFKLIDNIPDLVKFEDSLKKEDSYYAVVRF